ncbi:hypothetical protein VTN77DRAFT_7449 [Rasamsonia byssochlamydoides]|uniref:uncharacterized protein n=1 Tax=Rasamsonia byssochlamydoides TaxID=89139 RepID=UPI0037430341
MEAEKRSATWRDKAKKVKRQVVNLAMQMSDISGVKSWENLPTYESDKRRCVGGQKEEEQPESRVSASRPALLSFHGRSMEHTP